MWLWKSLNFLRGPTLHAGSAFVLSAALGASGHGLFRDIYIIYIYTEKHMHIYIYICMYVRTYVCMYVCMYYQKT